MTRHRKKKRIPRYQNPLRGGEDFNNNYVDICVEAKTKGQQTYIDAINTNKIVFCTGPAGSGKSHISTTIGLSGLMNNEYERLIITRPLIPAGGEDMGALPGSALSKIHPYLIPIYEEMEKHLPANTIKSMLNNSMGKRIEVVPLAFMRGRNFHNCFVVADEMENASEEQILMLLTRTGINTKVVLNGDFAQTDLYKQRNVSINRLRYLDKNVFDFGLVELTEADIVREKIVADIVQNWNLYDKEKENRSFK